MKKKYGFTLIELAAVIIILGIIIGFSVFKLSTRNADRYKAEICVNQIYGELSNFFHTANTSKTVETTDTNGQNTEVSPEKYEIKINDQSLTFQVYTKNTAYPIKELDSNTIKDCAQNNYKVQMTSNFSGTKLLPGLQSIGNQGGITLEAENAQNSTINTGTINFLFVQNASPNNSNEEFAKITLDRRSGILRKSFCQLYNTDDETTPDIDESKTCAQRSL